ncbi:MAG TPA: outer membrane lipoprotein-sorting protein [Blastocatellia bacterium]|nr:outer membrane lipoprotein-sorting protein [Blastocatellia bacterium]
MYNVKRPTIFLSIFLAFALLSACNDNSGEVGNSAPGSDAAPASATKFPDAEQIISEYCALDKSRDSAMRVRVTIKENSGASRVIETRVRRKRAADGSQKALLEIISPPEERDRNGLITVSADGDITATRYVQSSDSFASTTSVVDEDSLFGLSLQELADGQPEKYEHQVVGEETFNGTPVYRVEGKLKAGEESKFPRVVMLIAKDNNAALVTEYYDTANKLVRRVTVNEMEQVDGNWTRKRWTIDNEARQTTLTFEAVDVKSNQNLPDSIFTREYLKKTAMKR